MLAVESCSIMNKIQEIPILHFLWAFRLLTGRASYFPHNLLMLNLCCIRSEWRGCKRFESSCYSSRLDVGRSSKWALSSVVWSVHNTSPWRGSSSKWKWNASFRVIHYCEGVCWFSALYLASCEIEMWYQPWSLLSDWLKLWISAIICTLGFLSWTCEKCFYGTWYVIVSYIVKCDKSKVDILTMKMCSWEYCTENVPIESLHKWNSKKVLRFIVNCLTVLQNFQDCIWLNNRVAVVLIFKLLLSEKNWVCGKEFSNRGSFIVWNIMCMH